ncbi:hypothetical protein BJ322DRAFT_1112370 [Thelephora terrestris]|uniref:Uncharacterized protein n=1 Tax=Thelephora terrestris TaxID=56493 RepID=A0A9P6L2Y7_9AGAM|nr:hypothetical protein BJ322DRAFT_1112370 [Thelephora terrestris]
MSTTTTPVNISGVPCIGSGVHVTLSDIGHAGTPDCIEANFLDIAWSAPVSTTQTNSASSTPATSFTVLAMSISDTNQTRPIQPLCTWALQFKFLLSYKMALSYFFIMAGTRAKNKTARPAAPVMTNATKIKAGIPTAKRQTKKISKADQIRELKAHLATFEHPDDSDSVSKEPLFLRDSSPEDIDRLIVGSKAPTKLDAKDYHWGQGLAC